VAYPLWIVPWFEYINLDLFKEAASRPPANGNWTYDEFVAAAKKLTFKRADGSRSTASRTRTMSSPSCSSTVAVRTTVPSRHGRSTAPTL